MSESKLLLSKVYEAEEVADIARDVEEAIETDMPTDAHGFALGSYRVVITFTPAEQAPSSEKVKP